MEKKTKKQVRLVCWGCGSTADLSQQKIGSMTVLICDRCLELVRKGAEEYADTRPDNMEGLPKP
jgi:hypothetical protein